MRIAIANTYPNRVGGAEAYLDALFPALVCAGHQIAFWHEIATPKQHAIELPAGTSSWSIARDGLERSLEAMRDWRPDIVFVNGLSDPMLERRFAKTRPAVRFAHAYSGTCISGNKMFARPRPRPCGRRFGPGCIAHFYPYRCGGLNPIEMARLYVAERKRLLAFNGYSTIVTASNHMRTEYLNHGLENVGVIHLPIVTVAESAHQVDALAGRPSETSATRAGGLTDSGSIRLLYAGRMTPLKGGDVMIDALPIVHRALGRNIDAVFAGDGPMRAAWEVRARQVVARIGGITIGFAGWLEREALDSLMRRSDLLVLPSLWPEPFGMVGLEAGLNGLPAVAFASGGIPEWLEDARNGCLADANPPTANGLADAIIASVSDSQTLARMGGNARAVAESYTMRAHLTALLEIFSEAIGRTRRDA